MGDLSVQVRMGGSVVEDRVVRVGRTARIGEHARSLVHFPGADILVVRAGRDLLVRGRRLEQGDCLQLTLGPLEVSIEHTLKGHLQSELSGHFDARFLAVVLTASAMGAWLDSIDTWIERDPLALSLRAGRQELVTPDFLSTRGEASVQRPTIGQVEHEDPLLPPQDEFDLAQGPRHLPDDAESGTGWHAWYRSAVPRGDTLGDGMDRLRLNPSDANGHRMIAQAAYDGEDFELAAWHLRWLVANHPGERNDILRLARVEKRRGRHAREIDLYRVVLNDHPNSTEALEGLAVAMARLGRLDEARSMLDELETAAPDALGTELSRAMIAAIQGRDKESLEALDRVIGGRGQLSSERQLELRRDLALDPVFADLRKDKRFRALLHRHLGAAAPMPVR
mgnify:CR=1 FL=1